MNQTCWEPGTDGQDYNLPDTRRVAIWNRVIALTEIVGGAMGLALVAFSRISSAGIFVMLMAVMFGSAVYGGCLLWRGSRRGIAISTVLQGLQVLQFGVSILAYHVIVGPFFRFVVFTTGSNLRLGLFGGFRTDFFVWIGDRVSEQTPPFFGPADATLFGVNIVALLACIYLTRQLIEPRPHTPVV